jgi:aerobic-type carbon monoxide dehydrogenase small subunit (CoxS/CutS family)
VSPASRGVANYLRDAIENMCRCGTYGRIRQAIKAAAAKM